MKKQLLLTEINNKRCFRCGSTKHVIVHHLSYKPEITVLCCRSCHKKIHDKVRKQGLCPYSVEETQRLSGISSAKRRVKRTIRLIYFYDSVSRNVGFSEVLRYNLNTGYVGYSAYFQARNGKELYYLKEE